MIEAENSLIDHGQQNPVGDKARIVVGQGRRFAEFYRKIQVVLKFHPKWRYPE